MADNSNINYGKEFVDTYTMIDTYQNRPCGFICVPFLLTKEGKRYRENLDLVLNKKMKDRFIVEVEGVPCFKCRIRFIHSLRKCGSNFCRLYMQLDQFFTEEFIKLQFTQPNLWILHHNFHAKKAAITEQDWYNHLRKISSLTDQRLHREAELRTANRSVSANVRFTRSLQT